MKKKIHGKVVGSFLGLLLGGPWGAMLGFAVGHAHDNRIKDKKNHVPWGLQPSATGLTGNAQQAAFTMGVIVLGAKMAKADGRVTVEEVEAFKRVFHVPEDQVGHIGQIFDHARRSADGYEPYAFHLERIFHNRPAVLEEVMSGLFIIAAADSSGLSPAEISFLKKVAVIFKFSIEDFVRIAASSGVKLSPKGKVRDESYAILGLPEEATPEQIKLAYRALIRKHHPDKLVSQGMPPEFIANANEKMKRINVAYDTICKEKGIK